MKDASAKGAKEAAAARNAAKEMAAKHQETGVAIARKRKRPQDAD